MQQAGVNSCEEGEALWPQCGVDGVGGAAMAHRPLALRVAVQAMGLPWQGCGQFVDTWVPRRLGFTGCAKIFRLCAMQLGILAFKKKLGAAG